MGQLEDMAMFVRIVEAGGIGKASEQLNIAKSAVSRRLSELEERLATQLLIRTTRRSNLTDAGAQYYRQAKNIVEAVDKLNEQTSGETAAVEGTLRLTAPLSFGLLHLQPVIDDFSRLYPGLKFYIDFSDRHVDMVEEGYELGIRIGTLQESSYQARRLTVASHVLCASPEYLQKHGTPAQPLELNQQQFLHYGLFNEGLIELSNKQGDVQRVAVKAKIKSNNGDFLRDMAVKGHGISYLPRFLSYQQLQSGELVELLSDWQLPSMFVYAIYPKNRFLSQRCRLLIEYLAECFSMQPYWEK